MEIKRNTEAEKYKKFSATLFAMDLIEVLEEEGL